nr:MAG TPA: hypothetical protein [Bacteriophage sp.]
MGRVYAFPFGCKAVVIDIDVMVAIIQIHGILMVV